MKMWPYNPGVIGRTSKSFFIIDNAYYGLVWVNPVKHNNTGGQREREREI
jgi:hypothetical protein